MFKVMRKGLYLHPANVRGSELWIRGERGLAIDKMLSAPVDQVAGRVFYVGDRPFDLRTWVDAFHRALTGRKVRYIPGALVKVIAWMRRWSGPAQDPLPDQQRAVPEHDQRLHHTDGPYHRSLR